MEWIGTIIQVISEWVIEVITYLGYWGLFFGMAVESANIPLPSELILPLGGYLVSVGKLDFWGAVLAGTLGGTIGSVCSYWLGALGGRPFLLKYGKYIHFKESHLDTADRWFHRYGEWTVFVTRLLPIIRTFISLPAGISRMNFGKFVLFTFLGSLPWSILLVYVGKKLGDNWETIGVYFHRADILIVILLVVVLGVCFWRKYRKKKND